MAKDLPQEVINDILSRVPAIDLIKFRSVSKFWLYLLSIDLHFHKSHFNMMKIQSNPSIIAMGVDNNQLYYSSDITSCDHAKKIDLPFDDSTARGNYLIFGICNGLICLSKHSSMPQENFSKVHIWNPVAKDHVTIPCTPIFTSDLPTVFGFGCNQVTNEYKVILLYRSRKITTTVSVYTLGTKNWRTLRWIPYYVSRHSSCAPLINGALHWIAAETVSLTSQEKILSFDIKDEVFREILPPEYPRNMRVGGLGGLLSVSGDLGDKILHVWVMKEYGVAESWIKQFRIQQSIVTESGIFEPLGLASNHEIILRRGFRGLFLYNSFTESITKLKEFNDYFYAAFTYFGSFLSPKSYQGSDGEVEKYQIRNSS
ncbi:hypothetical protein ACHQM5_021016 [Ranunculus cassubicifolius]